MSTPNRYLALVKIDLESPGATDLIESTGGENLFIYLGEIPNMRGHCAVASYRTGRVIAGIHSERFIELKESEV